MNNSDNVLEPVGKSAYVYQLPIRIWHWTMVACVSVLIEEQGIDLEGAKTPPYELYK